MSSSSIQSKIQVLQARLVEENRSRDRDFSAGLMNSPLRGNQRHGTGGHRPRKLGEIGPPTRPRRQLELPFNAVLPRNRDSAETETKLKQIMKQSGILTINGVKYQTDVKDMEHLGELGNGTCGHVVKMLHKPSGEIIAVKQMRRTGNSEENKRIVMDIDVVLKSYDCPYIVQCLGCFIMESEVWICMELMATCFDKLLKKLKAPIPEHILGKVTVATVKALWYLKEKHDLIHRDVKPSNILLSEKGNVKLCDFGISGRLVDSKAKTKSAGCAAYMAPERIDPPDPTKPDYDIRADVWSLGITLVELALGAFPYQDCKTEFEVVCRIMNETPPSLPNDKNFSEEFQYFVNCCLTKNYQKRPKYPKLLEHPFFKKYEIADVAVDQWFTRIMQETETKPSSAIPRATVASSTTTTSATRNAQRSTPPSPTNRKQHSYHHASTGTPTNLTNGASSNVNPSAFSPPDNYTTFLPSTNERLSSTSASQETRANVTPNRNMYAQHENGKSIPAPFSHQIHHDHVGVTQKSPPDRYNILYDRSRTSSSPDRHGLQLTRSRIGNFNTPPEPNSRFSPFYQRRCVGSIANPYSQSPPSSYQEYGPNYTPPTEAVRRTPISSPLLCRKRADSFGKEQTPNVHHNIGNTSPIVLQRFYHQQSQLQKEQSSQEYQHPHFYSHLERRGSGPTTQSDLEAHKDEGKKPYASYFKLQLGSDRRRTQSPDPPPRLSRHAASGDSSQSPLTMRRALLEAACPGSPNLSRRYISPSPPQPPPRRLTESSSVPGSPQHVRARFQYTPEPQRRVYQNNDLS